jgi:hypothetical protein
VIVTGWLGLVSGDSERWCDGSAVCGVVTDDVAELGDSDSQLPPSMTCWTR